MRVLLTGGAGYVGSACLRRLLWNGHEAVAYDDLSAGNANSIPKTHLIVGDINDGPRLTAVLREGKFDTVMHFAALASVPDSINDPASYYHVNVTGTKTVLDAMRDAGITRLICSSTAATYSFAAKMPLNEESPQKPEVPYGTTKLAAEWMIKDYSRAYGLGYVIFRYFNASGAELDGSHGECRSYESHLIPLIFSAALGRRPAVSVFGKDYETSDGTCVRDYVHVDDIAQAARGSHEIDRAGQGAVLQPRLRDGRDSPRSLADSRTSRRATNPARDCRASARRPRRAGGDSRASDQELVLEADAFRFEHNSHVSVALALNASGRLFRSLLRRLFLQGGHSKSALI